MFLINFRMGTSALRRLVAEYKQILKNSPDGIIAGPLKEDNYFEWEAAITGPEGTVFEDGVFVARLVFPQDYPLNPPTMRYVCMFFATQIFEYLVNTDGFLFTRFSTPKKKIALELQCIA